MIDWTKIEGWGIEANKLDVYIDYRGHFCQTSTTYTLIFSIKTKIGSEKRT